nr:hypothetical protein BaRGS_014196 [Batillaria attramentaria]
MRRLMMIQGGGKIDKQRIESAAVLFYTDQMTQAEESWVRVCVAGTARASATVSVSVCVREPSNASVKAKSVPV